MNKRIKYILTILIFIITTFTLISCGSSNSSPQSPDNPSDIDDGDSTDGEPASDTLINASDYIEGLTFIYKKYPTSDEDILDVKNIYLSKIEEILTNISSYTDLIFNELNYKQVLLQYLIDAYNLIQINNIYKLDINAIDRYINSYISYVDHYGLLPTEEDVLNDVILDLICELKKDDVDTIVTEEFLNDTNNQEALKRYHPEWQDKTITTADKANITILDIDETNYKDNDGVLGFGSEIILKDETSINNISNTQLDFSKIKTNENNYYNLWTKETFIAKGLCTEEDYNENDYCYALRFDGNGKLELTVDGISSEYEIEKITKSNYDIYYFVSKITKKIIVNGNTETDKVINKVLVDTEDGSLIIKDKNNIEFSPIILCYITGKNFKLCSTDYTFDIALSNFKNYRNVVKACIERISNNWDIIPFINIEQLSLEEFNNNTSLEITNLTSVILDIKEEIKIKNIKLLVDSNDIINVNGYYYNKENYNYFDLGSSNTGEVLLDFSNKNILLDKHKTSTDISNYIIDDNHNIKYSDETSTYLMLSFETNNIINISTIEFELTK